MGRPADRDCEVFGKVAAIESAELYHRKAVKAHADAWVEYKCMCVGLAILAVGVILQAIGVTWMICAFPVGFGLGVATRALYGFVTQCRARDRWAELREAEIASVAPHRERPEQERTS